MTRSALRPLVLTLVTTLLPSALLAESERKAREVRPSYPTQRTERGEEPAPRAATLPDELRIAVPRDEVDEDSPIPRDGGAAVTRSGTDEPPDHERLRQRARQAAQWAAAETIDRHGRRRYFEIGFHGGLHDALERSRREYWELEQGRRDGRFDREARALGEEIGGEEAQLASAEDAHQLILEQFHDLGREPMPIGPPPTPAFSADGFFVPEPDLRQVFDDLRWRGPRRHEFRDLRLDPWRLFRAGHHSDFYDADWASPRFALDLWRKQQRKSSWWRGLDRDQRGLFESHFTAAFDAELAGRFAAVGDRAHGRGYDAGWRYGVRVGREHQYRRGYHQGFESAVQEAAGDQFAVDFRSLWIQTYQALFEEWISSVKLETRSASLHDGNQDGVFEPGEELFVEIELVNFGGGSERSSVVLSGDLLSEAEQRQLDLPRRAVLPHLAPLRGVVRAGARAHADASVTVAVGDLVETLPLRVSHVLQLEPGLRLIDHEVVRGEAVVEVRVTNTSRRTATGDLEATAPPASLRATHQRLPEITAGSTWPVRFELFGARPLDLLAGTLVLRVAAATVDRPQGELTAALPELATDLADPGLVEYLLWLASSRDPNPADVRGAQALMLRRLEADWRMVAGARGNSYRSDLRGGLPSTALGAFVAAARAAGPRLSSRSVVTDLVPRIESLSRSFGGTHPILRRSMCKLSRQLL
jgi:hypothetical protein